MEFLKANIGNIVVGTVVFSALAAVALRLFVNYRRGKSACGCENCPGCAKNTKEARPAQVL